jgi:molybdopterin synthase catalytic subunit
MPSEPTGVALVAVRDTPLSADEVLGAVRHPQCGGVALFVGVVRDHDHGESVTGLEYSAHPSAGETMERVCREVLERGEALRVAAVHRVGSLDVGDLAVVVAAARDLIDTLKASTPIWKHQRLGDGSTEWVGMP